MLLTPNKLNCLGSSIHPSIWVAFGSILSNQNTCIDSSSLLLLFPSPSLHYAIKGKLLWLKKCKLLPSFPPPIPTFVIHHEIFLLCLYCPNYDQKREYSRVVKPKLNGSFHKLMTILKKILIQSILLLGKKTLIVLVGHVPLLLRYGRRRMASKRREPH